MKRFLSLIIALALIVSLGCFAYADDTGSITVKNAVKDKYYTIYRIFNLTGLDTDDPADGEYNTASYTLDDDWVDFFIGASASGSAYLVEKTSDNASTYEDYNTLTYDGKTYFIYIGDGTDSTVNNISDFADEALVYAFSLSANDGCQQATADGDLEFSSLELGYYLVYPEGAVDKESATGSICCLTSTIPDAEVTQKASYPSFEKKINGVDEYSADVGEIVTFTLTSEVPDTTGYDDTNKFYFVIMDSAMGVDESYGVTNVSVKIDGTACTVVEKEYYGDLINMSSATWNMPSNTDWWYGVIADASSPEMAVIAFSVNMLKWQDKVGKDIEISYKMKASSLCYNSSDEEEPSCNIALLTYSNRKGDQELDPKNTSSITRGTMIPSYVAFWSNNIEVTKTDSDDNPLSGAKFALMNSDGEFLKETVADGDVTEVEWVEVTGSGVSSSSLSVDDATVNAIKSAADDDEITVKTSDDDGLLEYHGVADGTYYLVEIEAPEGYNMLDSAETVTVAGEKTSMNYFLTGDDVTVYNSDTEEVTVVNQSGTILPSTGGIGTTIFYIAGSLLVLLAAVLIITKRRMEVN